ncbi:hypothetical protein [Niallia sp. 03133]|uniref:hypothetical protein n=1 Tax=Niallia sp. 03133 TaxID=3458060 RepID=UPI0040442085
MKKGKLPLIIGMILLILSAPVIILMLQDEYYYQTIDKQYMTSNVVFDNSSYFIEDNGDFGIESIGKAYIQTLGEQPDKTTIPSLKLLDMHMKKIRNIGFFKQSLQYEENIIQLKDTFSVENPLRKQALPEKALSPVHILINNKDFTNHTPVEIRPNNIENERYFSSLGLILVKDKIKNSESLLIIQRFGDEFQTEKNTWRFLWIDNNGQIKKETFDNKERKQQPYRTTFINASFTTPTILGYKSNVSTYYTTYFYPLLYPWCSFLLGSILAIFGLYSMAASWKKDYTSKL